MKTKTYFYAFLGIYIVFITVLGIKSFRQNFPVRHSTYLTRIMVKNESKNMIKNLRLEGVNKNIRLVLDREVKSGGSTNIDINCGMFKVYYEDNSGHGCDWGRIDTCKETIIALKEKCPHNNN